MRISICALLLAASVVLTPSLASSQPAVFSIQPQSVPTVGGATITIVGANFGPAPGSVRVDGTSATVTLWTPNEIRFEAPEGDPGDAPLVVTDDLGTSSPGDVLSYAFPAIIDISPSSSPSVGGTLLTVTGANFGREASARTWSFGGTAGFETAWIGHDRVLVTTPPGPPDATVDVVLSINNVFSNPVAHTFEPGPVINVVQPSTGPTSGGALLTIIGANFPPNSRVLVAGQLAGNAISAPTTIICELPSGPAGETQVVVVGGNQVSPPAPFEYLGPVEPAPEILAVQPQPGPAAGGTLLTIQGSSFPPSSRVLVAGQVATNVAVSSSSIVCELPPGPPGDGEIVVVGSDQVSAPFPFAYADPLITQITPSSGPEAGGVLLTIRGENFGPATTSRTWLFGGVAGTESQWLDDGTVVVEAPPGLGVVDVEVVYSPPPAVVPGGFTYTGALATGDPATPATFALRQNRPNPFAGRTQIALDLAEGTRFRLAIFDINGRLVSEFEDAAPAGTRTVQWDGTDLSGAPVAAGVYFYRLEAGDHVSSKRMILTR